MSRGSEALTNARKEEIIDAFEKLFQIKSVRSILQKVPSAFECDCEILLF